VGVDELGSEFAVEDRTEAVDEIASGLVGLEGSDAERDRELVEGEVAVELDDSEFGGFEDVDSCFHRRTLKKSTPPNSHFHFHLQSS